MQRVHRMPFGATYQPGAGTCFQLWAPTADSVALELESTDDEATVCAMHRHADGWYEARVAEAVPGTLYRYRIDDQLSVPDPASRFNPQDVHGPSEVVDPGAYEWRDESWRGRPWHEAVVYELHVGTFTRSGRFAAVEARLDALVRLGVTAIELMPVADFPGRRGWGYDGVLLFAPESAYGRPEEFKRLIDAAHQRGLMVLLDVVYNHFGPEGNYLHRYARNFFTSRHQTPWGDAVNFDGADAGPVRRFFVENALYWLEEFHLDGLRIDAVHAIRDESPVHFIEELAANVHAGPGKHRHVHLVLENHHNEAHFLGRDGDGRPRIATAQWNDDLHHAAHTLLTRERDGYYVDYAAAPLVHLGRCLAEGFAFQGERYVFDGGATRGEPSRALPASAFVNFLQNHDQVGNRAFGERLWQLAEREAVEAMLAVVLLAPAVPMLFMGEEYAAPQPFLYFCDFAPELAAAVTAGRRREFARFARFADPETRESIPDPGALSTFRQSCLRWSDRRRQPHARHLQYCHSLLKLRQQYILPLIPQIRAGAASHGVADDGILDVYWPLQGNRALALHANLSARDVVRPFNPLEIVYQGPAPRREALLAAWQVRWAIELPASEQAFGIEGVA